MAKITDDIALVKAALDANGLVAIPTETVYGLAANGLSEKAVKKIFEVKKRPIKNPLILHFKNLDSISPFVKGITAEVNQLVKAFWPGPLTLLLPKTSKVPDLITANSNRVAVRVPDHPMTLQLLQKLDYPLAAPSANPSGYISPTQPEHVLRQLGSKIGWILDGGACTAGIESTIIGWEHKQPVIYRKGMVTAEMIGSVLGRLPKTNTDHKVLEAPGMLSSHYAPTTLTLIDEHIDGLIEKHAHKKIGLLSLSHLRNSDTVTKEILLATDASLEEMAKNLYAAMYELDTLGLDIILIEKAPEKGLGRAINDRLQRSAYKG